MKQLEERKKELYREAYVLQTFIKQWFKLKRYLPYEETKSFFPSAAYPSHIKSEEGEHSAFRQFTESLTHNVSVRR